MAALIMAAAVIAAAGYYEGPNLLFGQLVAIAGPTAVPLIVLPNRGRIAAAGWLGIAPLLICAWSYVVYVDTRPYQGGGASFAVLIGWFACFIATGIAVLVRVLHMWWLGQPKNP
jgi:hypothetical protein